VIKIKREKTYITTYFVGCIIDKETDVEDKNTISFIFDSVQLSSKATSIGSSAS
jgi:hypothetical protein